MTTTHSTAAGNRCLGLAILLSPCLFAQPVVASDSSTEREQLASIVRQLETLDHLLERAADRPREVDERYHFDYARLREDLARVRVGIGDYLTPQRAQPRDPIPLFGAYRRESTQESMR